MIILKRLKSITYSAAVLMLIAFLGTACNKSVSNNLDSPENEGNPQAKARKVLMIVMDGGLGTEVKKIAPPVMSDLSENSIFSWDALNTTENIAEVTNDGGMATLLTGVNPGKHGVVQNVSGNKFSQYPTIFTRLKTLAAGARSVAISGTASVLNTMAADATEKKTVTNDAAAKEAAVAELSSGNPDFLLVQFSGADIAGQSGGYLASVPAYRSAVLAIDTYVGDILTALNQRENAPNEDWMVVITSSKGNNTVYAPVAKPWSAFDDQRHNSFVIMANPRFAYNNQEKPAVFPYYGTTNSYRIGAVTGTSQRYSKVNDATKYNYGASGDFSVQCKVKIPSGSYYPSFLGKRAAFATTAGNEGWVFFIEGSLWGANLNGGTTGGNIQAFGSAITDNKWHTLNMVVTQTSATTRSFTVYTDGVKNNTNTGLGARNLNTNAPLSAGWRDGSNGGDIQMSITDIRIYNRALTDAEIASSYCRTDADLSDPSLVGFWPSNTVEYNASGTPFFRDEVSGNHLYMTNPSIVSFTEATPNACPLIDDVAYQTVPRNVDVAMQIYLWMGFSIPPSWGLEGQSWIPKYVDIVE